MPRLVRSAVFMATMYWVGEIGPVTPAMAMVELVQPGKLSPVQ